MKRVFLDTNILVDYVLFLIPYYIIMSADTNGL
jgi:hypothetical protein